MKGVEIIMKKDIPKYSYKYGFVDEGISDILNKPKGFKYSEKFLKYWYGDDYEEEKINRHRKEI